MTELKLSKDVMDFMSMPHNTIFCKKDGELVGMMNSSDSNPEGRFGFIFSIGSDTNIYSDNFQECLYLHVKAGYQLFYSDTYILTSDEVKKARHIRC